MRTWIDLVEHEQSSDFIEEVLYHGTREEFGEFDLAKNRTARHIYTSPDINTALYYGNIVYECRVRGPQANISAESTSVRDEDILSQVAKTYADHFEEEVKYGQPEWGPPFEEVNRVKETVLARLKAEHANDPDYTDLDAEWECEEDQEFVAIVQKASTMRALDAITNGDLYGTSSRLQDNVLEEVFDMGFSSVRFTDPNSQGESLSVVARTPADIRIVRRVQ